jgi:hypothetical protein
MAERESDPARLLERFGRAKARRSRWESLWQDCYDYALPYRGDFLHGYAPGERRADRLFDGTAPDAVDQLAASLLAQLTPPWSRWIGFAPGPELDGPDGAADREAAAPVLERMAETLQSHLDRSNFAVEMHQCFLDLVVGGSASLLVEEAPPGEHSALRFAAVPLTEAVLEEGPSGRLDVTFRRSLLTLAALDERFPGLSLPEEARRRGEAEPQTEFALVEAVLPEPEGRGGGFRYSLVLEDGASGDGPALLAEAIFQDSPYVNFRWLKAPGEAYGRSPVMKTLPDIKTANKVVELVLKNASIAVTGIWQADDDGVLNPAAVRLVPGTIIPKAVGSSGLTPLEAPGKFDVSQLVLDDLRARIRRALLADQLGQINAPRMTATEVLERSAQISRLLGATYGRLQAELLTPLVLRTLAILRRRGEVPDLVIDGRLIELQYRSPLAQAQAQRDVQTALTWIETAAALGPGALEAVDSAAAVRWLGERFGVPGELIRPAAPEPEPTPPEPAPPEPAPAPAVPVQPDAAALGAGLAQAVQALGGEGADG